MVAYSLYNALYIGYLGVSYLMEGLVNRPINIPVLWDSQIYHMNFWMMKSTQYYEWGIVNLFRCFTRFTTAMYIGYLGVSHLMEGLVNRPINIPVLWDS